ncbi:MAG TPA: GNAT family N-acetyltransferase [Candidatus Binatia bacterium]|nr:GNAT family N-acetyltransferase [Candidatus Binatia bacterium]
MSAPTVRILPRIAGVPASQWDALFDPGYPFTTHAFLDALERSGSVAPAKGWEPRHLLLERDGVPVAAMPCYAKAHSWGEFVFDFAWADAAGRLGLRYYPKLLCAAPFTPATGPRLGARSAGDRDALLAAAQREAEGFSSMHLLFLEPAEAQTCASAGLLARHDVQFHWHRGAESDFAGFAARLTHDKRKKIVRERRRVAEAGLRFETLPGDALDEAQWHAVYRLYASTYDERGQAPYLTPEFFLDYGRRAGTPIRLILARDGGALVAVAITFVGGDTLYGRHWGCAERHHSLHFETCYYQGIELCLREGLRRFDAGAQGAHKLARGFDPVLTRSAHAIADPRLRSAVAAFLARERRWIERQQRALDEHRPYRRMEHAGPPA